MSLLKKENGRSKFRATNDQLRARAYLLYSRGRSADRYISMLSDREGPGEPDVLAPPVVGPKMQVRYRRNREYRKENVSMPLLATSKS